MLAKLNPFNLFRHAEVPVVWDEYNDKLKFTPDLAELEPFEAHFLFIYCDLMQGHPSHLLIKDNTVHMYRAITKTNFLLYKKNLGQHSYPFAIENDMGNRVYGQLVLIETPRLVFLDRYKLNGVEFERKKVKVTVPYLRGIPSERAILQKDACLRDGRFVYYEKYAGFEAFMYVAKRDYWRAHMNTQNSFKVKSIGAHGTYEYRMSAEGVRTSTVRTFRSNRLGEYSLFTPKEYLDF